MINHARTLLGNLLPTTVDTQYYDEQYIPEDFIPIQLSTSLTKLREFFFGTRPDRSFINFRLREFLSVIRASLYGNYLSALDDRILLIDTEGSNALVTDVPVLVSTTAASTSLIQMRSSKQVVEADFNGWLDFEYELSLTGATEVRVTRSRPTALQITRTVNYRNGISEWFQLDSSGLSVKLFTQQVGVSWNITYRRRPQLSFGNIVDQINKGIGAEHFFEIFGLPNREEPYKTFYNLFNDPETVLQISGVVLASIYRAEELRANNG